MMYYKDGGFYPAETAPDEAVEISQEDYIALIEGQSTGKQIVTGADGQPILAEPQPSQYHHWDGAKWTISPEQQAVKKAEDIAKVREQINALRDRKINGGVYVKEVDKWLDTDATAERNLLAVKATFDLYGEAAGEIAWTCADNSILTINKDTLLVIWQAVMAAKTGNHANAMRHKAALEQADGPLAYDYSDGWTQCYHDYLKEQRND